MWSAIWLWSGFYCSLGFDLFPLCFKYSFCVMFCTFCAVMSRDMFTSSAIYLFSCTSSLQRSRCSTAHVSLEIVPRTIPFVVMSGIVWHHGRWGGTKIGSQRPACNSCLSNLARKISRSLSSGLYSIEYVPYIACPPNICLAPPEYLKVHQALLW